MEYQKLLGIAVGIAIISMCIRKIGSDGSQYLGFAFLIFVLGYCISVAEPFADYIKEFSALNGISENAALAIKACAIGLTTAFASNLCRSCGEADIAGGAELIGKSALLITALPLIKKLCEIALGLL